MKLKLLLVMCLIGVVFYFVSSYFALFKQNKFTPSNPIQTIADKIEDATLPKSVDYQIKEVARGLYVPWSIVFTSDTRVLVAERNGRIRIIDGGMLRPESLYILRDVSSTSEEGLMGMALDPKYAENKFIYICYAYENPDEDGELLDRVIRLRDNGSSASLDQLIIDNIPAATNHAGCRLKFGPDAKLYITTGDATTKQIAQKLDSLGGKILRLNSDGSVPADNPFSGSPVYTYGHRNPQGIAWFPNSKVMVSTEHGPTLFDGPAGGDELNIIEAGKNYGWPVVSHDKHQDGMEDPVVVYTPAVAPGSVLVYSGKLFPQFKDNLFFGGLRGEGVYRVVLDANNMQKVLVNQKISDINYGRIRDVVESPTGEIWFSTSNRDGRGSVRDGDDKIYKIIAK